MKEKSPGISVTKRRVTKLVAPVILVVVRSLGNRAENRHYGPGRVTLRVAFGFRGNAEHTDLVRKMTKESMCV